MHRRRVLTDGIFLEERDAKGDLVAELFVPAHLEALGKKMLKLLAVEHELSADRLPPGVLKFRRILQLEAIPRHSRASRP